MRKKISKVCWVLDPDVLSQLKACPECKENPAVFLTAKKVPCCRLCWEKLAECVDVASVEIVVPKVEECVDFEETNAKYPYPIVVILWLPRLRRALKMTRKKELEPIDTYRKKNLELINAELALQEEILRLLRKEEDRYWGIAFGAAIARHLYLWTKYPDCQACKKTMLASACLEAREKTGKCIFEVDFEQLQKLPWPTSKGKEAAE